MLNPICVVLAAIALVLSLGYMFIAQKFFSRFKLAKVSKEKTIVSQEWQIQPRTGGFSLLPGIIFVVVISLAAFGILWALGVINIELE